jgi:BMFP domain-containing protein YqiC
MRRVAIDDAPRSCALARNGRARLHADLPDVHRLAQGALMEKAAFLDDLQHRLASVIEGTPAADLQRNLKALLTQQFAQLDLVTRDEFDAQVRVLARSREKLQELERRLADFEARGG